MDRMALRTRLLLVCAVGGWMYACERSPQTEEVGVQSHRITLVPDMVLPPVLRTIGDINQDGYTDLFVAAPAAVRLGSPAGPGEPIRWAIDTEGWINAAASAGDVDGDGLQDVITGEGDYSSNTSDGRVRIFRGSASTLPTAWRSIESGERQTSENPDVHFGFAVASAGDVNADGYADILYGAPFFDTTPFSPGLDLGLARVHHGSSTGLSAPAWSVSGNQYGRMGWDVDSAGDVNDDGYSDVIVTAPEDRTAAVYHGSASGLSTSPSTALPREYYRTVAGAGDVNGDGFSDVVVGAEYVAPAGGVFIHHGSANGVPVTPSESLYGTEFGQTGFGRWVDGGGDVNGDGYSDVLVGSRSNPVEALDDRAFAFLGSPCGLSRDPLVIDLQPEDDVGVDVRYLDDLNGDGRSDFAVFADGEANIFFGAPRPTPECAPSGSGGAGGGGTSGAGGGGNGGSAGTAGIGGIAGTGEAAGASGAADAGEGGNGEAGAASGGSAGNDGSGGTDSGAGRQGEGGEPTGSGATAGSGSEEGGRPATNGGSAGRAGTGGTTATGGRSAAGGSAGRGGAATGGAAGAGTTQTGTPEDGGCGCRIAGRESRDSTGALALAALALFGRRRRRS
jgi:MYXO-CTERM domain-containing protein